MTQKITLQQVDNLLQKMGDYDLRIAMAYKLGPRLAGVLALLLEHPIVKRDDIDTDSQAAWTTICRLRTATKNKIKIHSHYRVGYYIDLPTKEAIRSDIERLEQPHECARQG
jgi:hypothetical protein